MDRYELCVCLPTSGTLLALSGYFLLSRNWLLSAIILAAAIIEGLRALRSVEAKQLRIPGQGGHDSEIIPVSIPK